ncbi:uncharacterized protein PAC_04841 [Phialocephala subalpina]|uniref:Uncharacterized protein n=1 Tax=Phialocephala subalpina TaxID=576137 RepID=A0A1L7WQC2_9HELO|nr:uncharacterized protein PAC_04841 [Phialocephala subalpina]
MKTESIAVSSLLLLSTANAAPLPKADPSPPPQENVPTPTSLNTTHTATSSAPFLTPVTQQDLNDIYGPEEALNLATEEPAYLGLELSTKRDGVAVVPKDNVKDGDEGGREIEERQNNGVAHQGDKGGQGAPKGNGGCVIL